MRADYLDLLKQDRRVTAILQGREKESPPTPESPVFIAQSLQKTIEHALQALPAEQAKTFPQARYVQGEAYSVTAATAPLTRAPSPFAALETEALYGEIFTVYAHAGDYLWGQLSTDGYVGYVPASCLSVCPLSAAPLPTTHTVCVPRTFLYPEPNIKTQPLGFLSLGAMLAANTFNDNFASCTFQGKETFVWAKHLTRETKVLPTLDDKIAKILEIAQSLLYIPYLWGGRSSLGLDCSALVQLSFQQAGIALPRDADLQEAFLPHIVFQTGGGIALENRPLKMGDLVFWKGHVGLLLDANTLIHANGFHMQVRDEPLRTARARIIEKGGGDITSIRRWTNEKRTFLLAGG
jgi:cell wall-associated NlpC family hydrolase